MYPFVIPHASCQRINGSFVEYNEVKILIFLFQKYPVLVDLHDSPAPPGRNVNTRF
jgi:hypothetical protein